MTETGAMNEEGGRRGRRSGEGTEAGQGGIRLVGRLADEAATRDLAALLAGAAEPGTTFLLEGPVGAGKSAFARAFITHLRRHHGQPPEEVPSPTYTIVQTYRAGPLEIWHADLYRLCSPDELVELGLEEAFETAVVLIEWPERLGELRPSGAVTLRLEPMGENARALALTLPAALAGRLAPRLAAFGLERNGEGTGHA